MFQECEGDIETNIGPLYIENDVKGNVTCKDYNHGLVNLVIVFVFNIAFRSLLIKMCSLMTFVLLI